VLGLGKTITESEFVASMNDDDLFHFLTVGREAWDPMNTSGITMPARGGNAALTDDNLRDIVQYMRVLNAAMAPAESSTGGSSEASAAGEVAAAPSSPVVVDDALAEQGAGLFAASCASCHGPDGAGVLGLGKNLVESEFVATMGDAELAQFIIVGREIWDPMNTSGLAMPARGGNAALTDDDIAAIVQHIRTLQQ
jgi:cytochrome c5